MNKELNSEFKNPYPLTDKKHLIWGDGFNKATIAIHRYNFGKPEPIINPESIHDMYEELTSLVDFLEGYDLYDKNGKSIGIDIQDYLNSANAALDKANGTVTK